MCMPLTKRGPRICWMSATPWGERRQRGLSPAAAVYHQGRSNEGAGGNWGFYPACLSMSGFINFLDKIPGVHLTFGLKFREFISEF